MEYHVLKSKSHSKIFVLIFSIMFTIFVLSSDGHRYTSDEDFAHLQTMRMVTLEPHPLFVEGESKKLFEYPKIYPPQFNSGKICENFVICSPVSVATSITQYPFVFINYNFNIIKDATVEFTFDDFKDQHYVFWRNSQNPDFTFLELFYGPIFAALSVSVFFLICSQFHFRLKTSLFLVFIFGLSTPIWAYSQTSLNVIPTLFFVLFSFYFFIRYKNTHLPKFLIGCGLSLGFAYLIRQDVALIIVPLTVYFLITTIHQSQKIKNLISYFASIIPFYFISLFIDYLRFGVSAQTTSAQIASFSRFSAENMLVGMLGLLVSPGVGLFIFSPILLTVFFTIPDIYQKNKGYALLFISTITLFLIYFGSIQFWHGLVSWSSRYLILTIPFFLLPLGYSLENRTHILLRFFLIVLSGLGFFFNLVYILQDVSWFVWGSPGRTGLFSLGKYTTDLYIHDAVIWTFDYSQLTHSITLAFSNLQPDLFFLKLLGLPIFSILLTILISVHVFIILKIYKKHTLISNVK